MFHINLLHGPFTPQIVKKALVPLQQKHPVLRLGFGPRPANWPDAQVYFYEYDNPEDLIQFKTIKKEPNQDWRELYADIVNQDSQTCFGEQKLLWDVTFLYDEQSDEHEIIWGFCHSIDDGISKVKLTQDFLHFCNNNNNSNTIESMTMHKSLEDIIFTQVFKNHLSWYQKTIPQTLRAIYKHVIFPPKMEWALEIEKRSTERKDCFIPISLSESETKEFAHKCYQKGVTVTSAIAAAAAKTIQEMRNAEDGFKLGITFATDLRRYTTEIPNGQIGMFTMWIDTIMNLYKKHSFWELANVYKDRLHQNPFYESAGNLWDFRGVVEALKSYATKIAGNVETQGRNKGISISSFGKFDFPVENGPFTLKNMYAVQSMKQFGSTISINCVTINNKMDFSLFYVTPIISNATANKFAELLYNQIKNC